MSASLRVSRTDAVARLTLARPEAGNALSLGLARELRAAAAQLGADSSCAAIVIDAEGGLFCGGGDLAEMSAASAPIEYVRELAGTVHDALMLLAESDAVVVAAVQGAAAGGGVGLLLNCDYVVAAENATFVSAYAKVGLSPDCGTSYLLPRVVGSLRASEFVLFGRTLDAATAHEWGIINTVEPVERVLETALKAAEKAARVSRAARAASKRLLRDPGLSAYRAHLDAERDSIAQLAGTDESTSLRAGFLSGTTR